MNDDRGSTKIYDDEDAESPWKTRLDDEESEDVDPEDTDESAESDYDERNKDGKQSKSLDSKELRNREAKSNKEDDDSDESGLFKKDDKDNKRRFRARLKQKSNRKWMIAGGGIGGIGVLVLLVAISLTTNLKIIHLAESVTSYNMARSARLFRQSLSKITAEAIDAETITDARANSLVSRFGGTKVNAALDKYNTYRPAKMLQELQSDLKPVITDTGKVSKITKRPIKEFQGFNYRGTAIDKTNSKFYKPVSSYKDKLRFASQFEAIIEKDSRGANSLVRGKVLQQQLQANGIKLRWWEKRGALYKNLKKEAAETLAQQEALNAAKKRPSSCALAPICGVADDAVKAAEETTKNAKDQSAKLIEANAVEQTSNAIQGGLNSKMSTFLSFTSSVYAVAFPVCLIYEGSIENSQGTIDQSEQSHLQSFMMVRSASDQQKAGATTSPAIAGLSGKLDNIGNSIPQRRAQGQNVDSAAEMAGFALPQASSLGTFSLLNVLFDGTGMPPEVIQIATKKSEDVCKVITSLEAGIGLAAGETILTIATLGTGKGLLTGARVGTEQLLKRVTGNIAARFTQRQGVRLTGLALARHIVATGGGLATRLGIQVGAVIAGQELAKLAVINHMESVTNSLATSDQLANQVDMGGNIYGQMVNRQQMFGKPMTTEEVANNKISDAAYLKDIASRQSFKERYLDLNNVNSFATRLATSVSSSFENPGAKTGSYLKNLVSSIVSVPRNIASALMSNNQVYAEVTTSGAGDYNIVQWGFTAEESNLIDNNPDYSPIENDLILEESGRKDEIVADFDKCFTKSIGALLADGDIQRETTGEVKPDDGDCAPNKLGLRNAEYGGLVFRWRLSERNNRTLDHLVDLQEASSL